MNHFIFAIFFFSFFWAEKKINRIFLLLSWLKENIYIYFSIVMQVTHLNRRKKILVNTSKLFFSFFVALKWLLNIEILVFIHRSEQNVSMFGAVRIDIPCPFRIKFQVFFNWIRLFRFHTLMYKSTFVFSISFFSHLNDD